LKRQVSIVPSFLATNLTQAPSDAYTPIELGAAASGNSLQWRYDQDSEQLEFAFKMPADSWVALGLRNKEAGAKCQSLLNFKDGNSQDELNSENSLAAGLNIRKIVGNYLSTTSSPGGRKSPILRILIW
jgi:hypothetical protein